MAKIKLYTRSIFEIGAVTVTGTPDTGYPESRLYDRDIDLYWKDTVTEAKEFEVDQGSTILDVDMLAIGKHNFNGKAMQWLWSDNGSDWTSVASWTQGDNNQIIKTLTIPLNHKYWKVTVASMTDPQCSEIYMSYGYEFQIRFDKTPSGVKVSNVEWKQSVGGLERSTKFGDRRRERIYSLFLDATGLTNFRAAIDDLDENSKPFYLKDHEGYYWLCRLLNDPEEEYINEGLTPITLGLIEKL